MQLVKKSKTKQTSAAIDSPVLIQNISILPGQFAGKRVVDVILIGSGVVVVLSH